MQAGQKMFWFFNYQINSCTLWTVNVVATTNFANWLVFQIELYRHTKIIIYSFKEKSKSSGRINFFHSSQIYTPISRITRFPLTQILGWRHFVDNDISWTVFFKMGDFSWTFSNGDFSWTLLVTSRGQF